METQAMGRVLTEASIESLQDLWDVHRGLIPPEKARRVVIPDALVDTGATLLSLPRRLVDQLGLAKMYSRRVASSTGVTRADVYGPVRLTIQGRYCHADVMEVPDEAPVLIGQLPLENLDFVIDPRTHTLIGNPAHGGEHMFEAYPSVAKKP